MKRKVVLILATLMCISLCACARTESTSGDNKENVSAPSESIEKEEVESQEEIVDRSNMTVEEMQEYYDVEEFVGTPTIMNLQVIPDKDNDVYFYEVINDGRSTVSIHPTLSEDVIAKLTVLSHYDCIVCDNNTPDTYADDVIAYIFID